MYRLLRYYPGVSKNIREINIDKSQLILLIYESEFNILYASNLLTQLKVVCDNFCLMSISYDISILNLPNHPFAFIKINDETFKTSCKNHLRAYAMLEAISSELDINFILS